MLIRQLLDRETSTIAPAIEKLFDLSYNNQTHPQDLLVLINNGYYEKTLEKNTLNLSPYVVGGPGISGLKYHASYELINRYRKLNVLDEGEFEASLVSADKTIKNRAEDLELMSLHQEHFIYLKFWESDYIIGQMFQLVKLSNGEDYDWDFTIGKQSRQDIWRNKIAGKIKRIAPEISDLINEAYKPQIRNAIAHSLFYFIGRTIHFTNHGTNPGDELKYISFEQWRPYIHKTIVLMNELIGHREKYNRIYGGIALKNNDILEIRVTKTIKQTQARRFRYYPHQDRWGHDQVT